MKTDWMKEPEITEYLHGFNMAREAVNLDTVPELFVEGLAQQVTAINSRKIAERVEGLDRYKPELFTHSGMQFAGMSKMVWDGNYLKVDDALAAINHDTDSEDAEG